ncbi:MAG: hypothetical protein ACE5R4_11155 [Armatimonadota bacterium]
MRVPAEPRLGERVRAVERATGKRIVLRNVRTCDPSFRGRIAHRPGYVVLEYRDDQPGYFWHVPIVEELLRLVELGAGSVTLYEGDRQYVEVPLR